MTPEHLQSLSPAQVRDAASDSWRDRDWQRLLRLEERLRQDALWHGLWCALCAIGARHLGRADAHELLREAVRGGFIEARLVRADLYEAFGTDDGWAETAAAIAANQPPQPFHLTGWPVQEPMWPLRLCRLPGEREELLQSRLPQRRSGAWETALATLVWVATRWIHANHFLPAEDAVQILDLVAEGGRFACPAYATVLSQSLNAQRVPARCVRLLLATHHAGVGRAHRVTEAWIDDLSKWVVLDGQNGLFWCDHEGTPLGLAELRQSHQQPGPRPDAICLARSISEQRLDAWWDYFAGPCSTAGRLWAPAKLGLMCEGHPLASESTQPDARGLYPRLDLPSVGLAAIEGHPALVLGCVNPYATGFYVRTPAGTSTLGMDDPVWRLEPAPPGDHSIEIGVTTEYGQLPPHVVSYQTA